MIREMAGMKGTKEGEEGHMDDPACLTLPCPHPAWLARDPSIHPPGRAKRGIVSLPHLHVNLDGRVGEDGMRMGSRSHPSHLVIRPRPPWLRPCPTPAPTRGRVNNNPTQPHPFIGTTQRASILVQNNVY